jgi:hypothetical protein
MKLSETVRAAIALARAANQARVGEDTEDDSPLVIWGGDTAMMKTRTAEERRLREFLEAQPAAVVYLLIAIMYLGRGDFEAKDLLDQYTDMREMFGNPTSAVRRMFVKLPLPDYLEQGLNKLARAGIDVDKVLPG